MENGESSYRRFLDGDESAFSEIIRLYRDPLIFYLNRTLQNLSIAEELAADALSELLVHPKRYNFSVSLKTYLFTIGHHKMVDYIRHNSKYQLLPYEDAAEKSLAYESFENQLLMDELKKELHEGISQLPAEMQMAIHLVYFENMTYEETAMIMKKNRKQVDNLIYRGKTGLRTWMEERGYHHAE